MTPPGLFGSYQISVSPEPELTEMAWLHPAGPAKEPPEVLLARAATSIVPAVLVAPRVGVTVPRLPVVTVPTWAVAMPAAWAAGVTRACSPIQSSAAAARPASARRVT
jgi:hypothetical protein